MSDLHGSGPLGVAGDARIDGDRRELVSVVIPTYREYAFARSLDALLSYLRTVPLYAFELLVVDDSDDATQAALGAEIAERREALAPGITLELVAGPKRGKGAAVRVGARRASGSIVFVLDADLPVPLRHIEEFLATMRSARADVLVGERSRDRYAKDYVRHVLSRGLWLIQRTIVFQGSSFEDTQCGFKAFRGDALRALVDRQIVDGGMYDLEYLYAATKQHLVVLRLAVDESPEVRPTRIRLLRCLLLDPLDIVRVKARGLLGRYT
jgi:glycosyltransferase involved in cell wall biosynthesis